MRYIQCHPAIASATVAALMLGAAPLEAQIGGLVRRAARSAAVDVATPVPPPGPPDVYTEHLLELVPGVLDKVIAGKQAGNRFAVGPEGPAALRDKRDDVFVRSGDHYDRNQLAIQRGEELVDDQRRCADSTLHVLGEQRSEEVGRRMMTDVSLQRRIAELSQKVAEAQQRGDTLALKKLSDEMNAFTRPTAADSASAQKACPQPATSPEHQQYVAMQNELKALETRMEESTAEVARLEQGASGLTRRQIALACERIMIYLDQVSAKKGMKGFSATELEALEQRRSDLGGLCT